MHKPQLRSRACTVQHHAHPSAVKSLLSQDRKMFILQKMGLARGTSNEKVAVFATIQSQENYRVLLWLMCQFTSTISQARVEKWPPKNSRKSPPPPQPVPHCVPEEFSIPEEKTQGPRRAWLTFRFCVVGHFLPAKETAPLIHVHGWRWVWSRGRLERAFSCCLGKTNWAGASEMPKQRTAKLSPKHCLTSNCWPPPFMKAGKESSSQAQSLADSRKKILSFFSCFQVLQIGKQCMGVDRGKPVGVSLVSADQRCASLYCALGKAVTSSQVSIA